MTDTIKVLYDEETLANRNEEVGRGHRQSGL